VPLANAELANPQFVSSTGSTLTWSMATCVVRLATSCCHKLAIAFVPLTSVLLHREIAASMPRHRACHLQAYLAHANITR
jgi:hypothetical protein